LERPVVFPGKRSGFVDEFAEDPRKTVKKYSKGSRFNALARMVSPVLRRLGLYTLAVRVLSITKGVMGSHAKQS
jgi:hypothetical protein